MQKRKSCFLVGAALLSLGVAVSPVHATDGGSVSDSPVSAASLRHSIDPFVFKKAWARKGYQNVPILFYPGSTGGHDKQSLMVNFLPFSNAISEYAKINAVLVIEKSWKGMGAQSSEHDFIYVPSLMVPNMVRAGFLPLVRHSDDDAQFVGALMTRATDNMTRIEDLRGKKITWIEDSQIGQQMKASLAKVNIVPSNTTFYDAGGLGQSSLRPTLDSGAADAVLVRKSIAEKWLSEAPGKYKIIAESYRAPGFTLMTKKELANSAETKTMVDAWIASTSPNEKAVHEGLKRGSGLTGKFVPAKLDNYRYVDEMNKIAEASWKR